VTSFPVRLALLGVGLAAATTLVGCGGSASSATPPPATAAVAQTAALTVTDAWVKAADGGMTAVYGTLTATSAPVTVASASSPVSGRTELHEVVESGGAMVMRQKEGGFVVQPGSPHTLAPGGDHIMLMDLTAPVRAGDQVEVTLTLGDGSTVAFTALAKEVSAGEEKYEDGEMSGHESGSHG